MTKFHINSKGVPAPCKATKGNCPLGGNESHFESQEEAQNYADKVNKDKYGLIEGIEESAKKEVIMNWLNDAAESYADEETSEFIYNNLSDLSADEIESKLSKMEPDEIEDMLMESYDYSKEKGKNKLRSMINLSQMVGRGKDVFHS